jgi:hypothetical protein
MTQVVECLLSKCKALSSNPGIAKTEKKKRKFGIVKYQLFSNVSID